MSFGPKIDAGIKLTVQIVNFRSRHYLRRCLFSIEENSPDGIDVEILVVNNEEERGLKEVAEGLKGRIGLRILELGKNVGFGRAHNAGFRQAKGKYVLFLNPDTKILPGALRELLDIFEKDREVGIVGPLLVDSDGKVQPDCFGAHQTPLSTIRRKIFQREDWEAYAGQKTFETDWISGGAMLVRRDIFEKIGGFDENYFMYFEDVDLCLRAKKAGLKVILNPKARVFHESGKSFTSEREKKKHYYISQDYYLRKHFGLISSGIVKLMRLPYYAKNVWLGNL